MKLQWNEVDRERVRGKDEFEGLDPYATWSLSEVGKKHLFSSDEEQPRSDGKALEFQVLLELKDPKGIINARDFAEGKLFEAGTEERRDWQRLVKIPRAYRDLPPSLADVRHITAIVEEEFFRELGISGSDRLGKALARVTLSRPVLREAMRLDGPGPRLRRPEGQPLQSRVVVGIIDDGIAFGHEQFRYADGTTRIESIWLQDGYPPSAIEFDYGRELSKRGPQGIDQLLAGSRRDGVVDEDDFYSRAGVLDFARPEHKAIAWRRAHGTHILDLATGPKPGCTPQWPIVCVQLPVATTADTSGATLAVKVIDGIWYILLKSLELGPTPPSVVINLSYGTIAGPHDGTSHLECAIDDIVERWERAFPSAKVRVVISAGNSHLGRIHARIGQSQFRSAPEHSVVLPWRILPDDRTPSYVEVWLPHRAAGQDSPVKLSVVTPDGCESHAVGHARIGGTQLKRGSNLRMGDDVLCQVSYEYASPPTGRGVFLVAVSPTAAMDESGAKTVAPFGIWQLKLTDISLKPGEHVSAWIQRDDTSYGFPTAGRQSYFDDRRYQRFDAAGREEQVDCGPSIVKREGSLNAIATGETTIVIGGVLRKELLPAKYSAGGPVEKQRDSAGWHRTGPDALAPSDDSAVLGGILAAGTRSGSVVAMNGTSVAAPLITRWIAGQLAAGHEGDRRAVNCLGRENRVPLPPGPPGLLSAERAGGGRIVGLPPHHPLRVPKDLDDGFQS
jgi:hypothetical protein